MIEAGFAAASPGDFARDRRASRASVEGPIICSLARATRGDISRRGDALAAAPRKRIHVFLGTSPIHREAKLQMDRAQVLGGDPRQSSLMRASFADDVEFSAEDAIRTERDFLVECLSRGRRSGRDHAQRPRHGRLHHARGDLRPVPPPRRDASSAGRT